MTGTEFGLVVSVFLACSVEAVEALTVVLAVGAARSWSSALYGAGTALLVLVIAVAAFGPALTAIPLNPLRVIVGCLLIYYGLHWLRKAVLRAAGVKALRDEAAAFVAETEGAREAPPQGERRIDPYAYSVAFKGVLLEGLEVVVIVVTFGAAQHRTAVAAVAAVVAVAVVASTGILVRRPLARVPENTMKFVVGVMLTSFGAFWGLEGAGFDWPGGEAALLAIIPCVLVVALTAVARLRAVHDLA